MTQNGQWARFKRLALSVSALLVSPFLIGGLTGIRINASPSLPIGLYAETKDQQATLVEFCPPEPYASLAIRRGYRTQGTCPDGATPLLKPIAAREGDHVELSPKGIRVNGHLLPNTAALQADTSGRPMPMCPISKQQVSSGNVWVISTHNPRSFDSRYFGPISSSSIRGRLTPIATY